MYLPPFLLQYAMLGFTGKEGPANCVQITVLNLPLVMQQNVIILVMENLIFLMKHILLVVRQLCTRR